ncbi:hypothetical protein VU02_00565 [Desulfobulbus sp. N2]|nr:hypothetical protein [Desulfobulbus sp. N2]
MSTRWSTERGLVSGRSRRRKGKSDASRPGDEAPGYYRMSLKVRCEEIPLL